ncbi:MAG TPA: ABC transporter substrate-binding protein [Vicinamibacteria bacterium]|nr:ABC transporter substrate-binding protein [Vicinamibacteria bacterium]
MRVVSLLPAATEIVCALGLRGSLVGRSHECDHPQDVTDLPALTKARVDSALPSAELDEQVRRIVQERLPIYMLDTARLAALDPDVIVTQEACEVCAISYDQVVASVRRLSRPPTIVSLKPTRLFDIPGDVRRVAAACGIADHGESVAADLERRLDTIASTHVALEAQPRVAVIEWLGPFMLAGHWVPEAVAAAGGRPVGPRPGEPSPYASLEEIRGLRPDAVVVAPCGFDLERTIAEAEPCADTLRALCPRVLLMDGNAYLNRPGPRVVDAVEAMAAWLRGEPVRNPLVRPLDDRGPGAEALTV